MLYALGAVEGRRIIQPLDPVAAWLLRQHPGLLPSVPQPALLSTMRARTDVVDRMVREEVHRSRLAGERVAYWAFGGGFDARWFRMVESFSGVVADHHEVESEDIVEIKHRLLGQSPYAPSWTRVQATALPEADWTARPNGTDRMLVVVEHAPGRLEDGAIRHLLQRMRGDAPMARVILGLAADAPPDRWSRRAFAAIGWQVDEDVWTGTRGRLTASGGVEVCPGMYPFRVVRLSSREVIQ
jgi:hypothetical protein